MGYHSSIGNGGNMNKQGKIEQLLINHTYQKNKHEDISGIGSICPATKREVIRAYKRIGKPPPADVVVPMKLFKRKVG